VVAGAAVRPGRRHAIESRVPQGLPRAGGRGNGHGRRGGEDRSVRVR